MKQEYKGTEVAYCPECERRIPGHVFGLGTEEVNGWTCPVCASSYDPTRLDERRKVEVEA